MANPEKMNQEMAQKVQIQNMERSLSNMKEELVNYKKQLVPRQKSIDLQEKELSLREKVKPLILQGLIRTKPVWEYESNPEFQVIEAELHDVLHERKDHELRLLLQKERDQLKGVQSEIDRITDLIPKDQATIDDLKGDKE